MRLPLASLSRFRQPLFLPARNHFSNFFVIVIGLMMEKVIISAGRACGLADTLGP